MTTATEDMARQCELRKRRLIVSVLTESTVWPVTLAENNAATEHRFLRVTEGETEALFELLDELPAIQFRRVYSLSDYELLRSTFSKASRLLSNPSPAHESCPDCWEASPAIAVRHCFESPTPSTGVLYRFPACGESECFFPQLEETLSFLRSNLVDAFVVWLPRYLQEEEVSLSAEQGARSESE